MKKTKIAIVDDEKLIVDLLESYLEKTNLFDVSITANDGDNFLVNLENSVTNPKVLLLDLRMKSKDGLETTYYLQKHYPDIRIIIMSSYYEKTFIGYMLKSGVSAFIPKNIPPQKLVTVIQNVINFDYHFLEDQIDVLKLQISSRAPKPKFSTKENLTQRELEILKLICEQFTNQEIADKLFISKRTVEGHRTNLLLKTGVKNTAGLVIFAISQNIFNISSSAFTESYF